MGDKINDQTKCEVWCVLYKCKKVEPIKTFKQINKDEQKWISSKIADYVPQWSVLIQMLLLHKRHNVSHVADKWYVWWQTDWLSVVICKFMSIK